jgi:hypothetical protein
MTVPPSLHIISFDIPWPPNYGGVIDVFYKLKALKQAGVRVILHCFEYHRKPSRELEELCGQVYYYPRATGWKNALSMKPYIVASRRSESLIQRLLADNNPILFEGLHSCFYLGDERLKKRLKIYRESNIEHVYYYHLFRAEPSLMKRCYFLTESLKLFRYQKVLRHAGHLLPVSMDDAAYLQRKFPGAAITYLPSFHGNETVSSLPGRGNLILYQGKLSVPENLRAAEFILKSIYDETLPDLVIAGMDPPESLIRLAGTHSNVRIIANPGEDEMRDLIRQAHINLMVTFQPTGLKLKLLNALFQGRFCLVNPPMLAGTGLNDLCETATTPGEFRQKINDLFTREFKPDQVTMRESFLAEGYADGKKCSILTDIIAGKFTQ